MARKWAHTCHHLWPRDQPSLFPSPLVPCRSWSGITAVGSALPSLLPEAGFCQKHSVAGLQISTYSLGGSQNRQTTTVKIDTHRTETRRSEKPSLNFKDLIFKKRLTVNTCDIQLHSVKIDSQILPDAISLEVL